MKLITIFLSMSGILTLVWVIIVYFKGKVGRLEIELGWSSSKSDQSTDFIVNVYNRGDDTRVIDKVSVIWRDGLMSKDQLFSTEAFVKRIPKRELKRGEVVTERISYSDLDKYLVGYKTRPFVIRVRDTMGKIYDSDLVNADGLVLR